MIESDFGILTDKALTADKLAAAIDPPKNYCSFKLR
jgi:hypothetical protein